MASVITEQDSLLQKSTTETNGKRNEELLRIIENSTKVAQLLIKEANTAKAIYVSQVEKTASLKHQLDAANRQLEVSNLSLLKVREENRDLKRTISELQEIQKSNEEQNRFVAAEGERLRKITGLKKDTIYLD